MIYLKGTEADCIMYDKHVSKQQRYRSGDNWANPQKHPNLDEWAILKHKNYSPEEVIKWDEVVETVTIDGEDFDTTTEVKDDSYVSQLFEITEEWFPATEEIE